MRLSKTTLKLLADLGDTSAKLLLPTKQDRIPWIYTAHNGQITSYAYVQHGFGRTQVGLAPVAVVPPSYT